MADEQARMMRILNFLLRVSVLSVPLYLIIWLGVDLTVVQLAVASHSSWFLSLMGYQVVQEGLSLTMGNGFKFFIIADCTGWKSLLFLFALLFAVPGVKYRKRLIGLAIGIPLIWLGNLLRIAGVVFAQGIWGTGFALVLHDWLFQLWMTVLVLGAWVFWLLWAENRITFSSSFWHRK
jgi:exosortase/archaeosortase family protein